MQFDQQKPNGLTLTCILACSSTQQKPLGLHAFTFPKPMGLIMLCNFNKLFKSKRFLQKCIVYNDLQNITLGNTELHWQQFSFFLRIFCRNPLGFEKIIHYLFCMGMMTLTCLGLNGICATAQAKLEVSMKYAPSACTKIPWQAVESNSNNSQVDTIEYTSGPMATCNHTWQSFKPVSFKNTKSPFWQEPTGDSFASKQVVISVCSSTSKCFATNCCSIFVGLHAEESLAFCEKTNGFCTAMTSWQITSDITLFSKAMVLLMLVQYPWVPKQISSSPKQTKQKPRPNKKNTNIDNLYHSKPKVF